VNEHKRNDKNLAVWRFA